jgi:ABC-2 type transport system permease protein
MRGSVVGHLILKDWQLQRWPILASMVAGALALAIFQRGGETAFMVGCVWFFVALIVIGCMLPIFAIVNERKKQNLPFLMSLPISPMQYTTAKLVSTVGMFLAPWLTLAIAAILIIEIRGILPHGTIPITLILLMLPFVGFCVISGAALVGESEGWSTAATVVCNSSYGLTWYFLTKIPALTSTWNSPVAIWSSTAVAIFGGEFASIVLILGLTFFLQSRKRDFV